MTSKRKVKAFGHAFFKIAFNTPEVGNKAKLQRQSATISVAHGALSLAESRDSGRESKFRLLFNAKRRTGSLRLPFAVNMVLNLSNNC